MTEEQRQALTDWFVLASGLETEKVLLATGTPDRGPRPDLPYAQLHVTTPAIMIGQDERSEGLEVSGGASTKLTKQRHAMVSAQVFGPGAADYLEAVREAISVDQFIREASARDLAVLDVTTTLAIPQLLDTGYEERAQADLTVGWVDVKQKTYDGTIESADVDGTADGATIDVEAP